MRALAASDTVGTTGRPWKSRNHPPPASVPGKLAAKKWIVTSVTARRTNEHCKQRRDDITYKCIMPSGSFHDTFRPPRADMKTAAITFAQKVAMNGAKKLTLVGYGSSRKEASRTVPTRFSEFSLDPEARCHSIWKMVYFGLLLRHRPRPLGCWQTSPGMPQRTMK